MSDDTRAMQREAWAAVVGALPVPAALVDEAGAVLAGNRWLGVEDGATLLRHNADVAPGLAFGADGTTRWRVRPLDNADASDAAVLLATAERLHASDHLLRRFFSSGESLFVVYDQAGRIVESNKAWENLLGYSADEVFGLDSWTLLPPDDLTTRAQVEADLRDHGRAEPVFQMRRSDGSFRLVKWALHFDTTVGRCFGIGRDITDEDRIAQELHRRATTDELTGLANRATFVEALSEALADGALPSVMFMDLDNFKVINDSLGHHAGDILLAALGRRLDNLAESEDSLVGRLGGDEFVVMLRDSTVARAIGAATETIEAMEEPFVLHGRNVQMHLSIGISHAVPGADADALLGEADTAAYEAKERGRAQFVVFDSQLRDTVNRRFNVEASLRTALDEDRIDVMFQPIVQLPGRGVVGAEALVRLRSHDGAIVAPGQFLDVAFAAGLMPRIGRRVLELALKAGRELSDADRHMILSVNLSASELGQPDIVDYVASALDHSGFPAEDLLIEITESVVLATDAAIPVLHQLRELGLRIALDDFGTGFSSLAHLRQLPIDVVKIDRSFVADLERDPVTRALTASLIDLCTTLQKDVVVEGIETADQASAVEQLGAHRAQGFLFHRPMPFAELHGLVTKANRVAHELAL